jgi:hypothetical protein
MNTNLLQSKLKLYGKSILSGLAIVAGFQLLVALVRVFFSLF